MTDQKDVASNDDMPVMYTKKPVTVESMRFTAKTKNRVHSWVSCSRYAGIDAQGNPCLVIKTLEGEMTASLGDYIIKGVQGEFYPCKPDIFEQTYTRTDTLNQQAASHDLKAAENDGIVKGVAHIGAYLVDKHERKFNGGEDEISKFCDDIALSLTGSAATPAPVAEDFPEDYAKEIARAILGALGDTFPANPEKVDTYCISEGDLLNTIVAELSWIDMSRLGAPAPVEPFVEDDEDNFEYLLWCIKEQIKLYAPHILKFWQWQKFEAAISTLQPVPEQECTCDYTEIKMTDCPIHCLNAKKEPPANQEAVRGLVKLVKAIHLSSDGQWLYGEYGEAEWIADRDAALARLEGE